MRSRLIFYIPLALFCIISIYLGIGLTLDPKKLPNAQLFWFHTVVPIEACSTMDWPFSLVVFLSLVLLTSL